MIGGGGNIYEGLLHPISKSFNSTRSDETYMGVTLKTNKHTNLKRQ